MELILRHGKNELSIDHQEGSVGFTVLLENGNQLDFDTDLKGWKRIKTFIDDDISEYENDNITKP